MPKYIRIEPIIVLAMQFDRNKFDELVEFTYGRANNLIMEKCINGRAWCYVDKTGPPLYEWDYVINSAGGELTIVKKESFEKQYRLNE